MIGNDAKALMYTQAKGHVTVAYTRVCVHVILFVCPCMWLPFNTHFIRTQHAVAVCASVSAASCSLARSLAHKHMHSTHTGRPTNSTSTPPLSVQIQKLSKYTPCSTPHSKARYVVLVSLLVSHLHHRLLARSVNRARSGSGCTVQARASLYGYEAAI